MDDLTQYALEKLNIRFTRGSDYQEMRVNALGGGPGGMEVIVSVDAEIGTRLAVWNPYRNEWAQIEIPRAAARPGTHEYAPVDGAATV